MKQTLYNIYEVSVGGWVYQAHGKWRAMVCRVNSYTSERQMFHKSFDFTLFLALNSQFRSWLLQSYRKRSSSRS